MKPQILVLLSLITSFTLGGLLRTLKAPQINSPTITNVNQKSDRADKDQVEQDQDDQNQPDDQETDDDQKPTPPKNTNHHLKSAVFYPTSATINLSKS